VGVVVAPVDVKFGKIVGALELVNEVRDKRERGSVFDRNIVQIAVVLDGSEFAILFSYEKEGAGHGRLRRADVAAFDRRTGKKTITWHYTTV
jgi:hypothetical protein